MKDEQGHGSNGRGGFAVDPQRGPTREQMKIAGREMLGSGFVRPEQAAAQIHSNLVSSGQYDSTHHSVGGYHAGAVQKSIESSRRSGQNISGREAKMIHALLRGRG